MRPDHKRRQINIRCDDELMIAIGELQRLDTSSTTTPSITEAIRRAVMERRNRLRGVSDRRK